MSEVNRPEPMEAGWSFEFDDVELGTFEPDVETVESSVETTECSWGSWRPPRRIYRHASACRDVKEFLYG